MASGRGTDLWTAIRQPLASESPAAMILFTDGQKTGNNSPQAAAEEAKLRGVPLLIVGVGDPTRRRNLWLSSEVFARPQVWQDEPFEIDAPISTDGIEPGEVRAELIEQRIGENDAAIGDGTVVQTTSIRIGIPGERASAAFSHTRANPAASSIPSRSIRWPTSSATRTIKKLPRSSRS